MLVDLLSPIYLGLAGLALLLFWSPVSRAEESAPPAAGPTPTLVASEAGPSPSPTATPPRTAAENGSFAAAFRRGWDAANERRYHDAVTEYSEAIRLKPDDPALYNNRGAVYQILKQYPQAIADYNRAISLKPSAAGYNNRGNAYRELKQYENAESDYTEAIRLKPDFADGYYNLALTYNALQSVPESGCQLR
jgi:tetratricopeptide (TPR) repeat protein